MSRLLERIATLNFNVIRVAHEHPTKVKKFLNGGSVRVVVTQTIKNIICTEEDEKSVIKALRAQFNGRISDVDLSQIGFFHYNNMKLGWFIQAMRKDDERVFSDNIFDTENNVFWLIIGTARNMNKHHRNRIQHHSIS